MAFDITTLRGTVASGSHTYSNLATTAEMDTYAITLNAGASYNFHLSGSSAASTGAVSGVGDSFLTLYDASGNLVMSNDDSGGNMNSLISAFTPVLGGTYYLEARSYGGYYSGGYDLFVEGGANVAPILTGTPAALTNPTVQSGAAASVTLTSAQLLQGFTDADSDTLSVTNINASSGTLAASGSNWIYTGAAGYTGSVNLTYNVTDGAGGHSVAASNGFTITPAATPQITMTRLGDAHTSEAGGTVQYSISLSVAPSSGGSINIALTSSDTTEGVFVLGNGSTAASQTLTFSSTAAQIVTVQGVQDYLADGSMSYTIGAVASQGGAPAPNYGGLNGGIATFNGLYATNVLYNDADLTAGGADRDIPVALVGDDGRPQADNLQGNDGGDRLYGGYMADELHGGNGNDRAYGGYEDDFLYGDAGDDQLYGEQDNDYLVGGAGNDRLDGGIGADTLVGGDGNDTYFVTLSDFGNVEDTIVEANTVAGGVDTIFIPFAVESYVAPAGVEIIRMNAGFGATAVTGNSSNNTIVGNAGDNALNGGAGNDALNGGSGSDNLIGGLGNDSLAGGTGNDVIDGGVGRDVISGGVGADTFDFNLLTDLTTVTATSDVISDFVRGTDHIDLSTIDSNAVTAGNQAFSFVTTFNATNAAGQIRFAGGFLYGSTDADTAAEFVIAVTAITTMSAADFVL